MKKKLHTNCKIQGNTWKTCTQKTHKYDTIEQKAYIAGFLDGDGCINAQIVKRPDYKLQFQIRVTLTFFQKTKRHWKPHPCTNM